MICKIHPFDQLPLGSGFNRSAGKLRVYLNPPNSLKTEVTRCVYIYIYTHIHILSYRYKLMRKLIHA